MKIATCLLLTVEIATAIAWSQEPPPKTDESAVQRAELNMLRSMVKSQVEQIEKLKAQNAALAEQVKRLEEVKAENAKLAEQVNHLEQLCANEGIVITPPAGMYVYLGKLRSEAWFEDMYKRFADQIALVDGQYVHRRVDLARVLKLAMAVVPSSPGRHERGCRVMQVIDEKQMLVRDWGIIAHITGVRTAGLVDGTGFGPAILTCIGTYRYKTVTGAAATVPSYAVVHIPLTREQFAGALAAGVPLVTLPGITDVPVVGDETPLVKVKANPRDYIDKPFILVGALSVTDHYAGRYSEAKASRVSLCLDELRADASRTGDIIDLYVSRSFSKALVDAVTETTEKGYAGKLVRVRATIVRDRYDDKAPAQAELLDWQFSNAARTGWQPWALRPDRQPKPEQKVLNPPRPPPQRNEP